MKFSKIANVDDLVDTLKCWIAFKLGEKGIESVRTSFSDILSACFGSQCFNGEIMEVFITKLEQHKIYRLKRQKSNFIEVDVRDASIDIYCRNLIDFLKFDDLYKHQEYIDKISFVKSKTKINVSNRELISYADILKFKKYIDFWAEDIEEMDRNEYLKFFPVYLWWEITTVIPMRPTEFCHLQNNCISKKGNRYYLTFPRFKQQRKGENRFQDTYDTLPIPRLVYERIESYIKVVNGNVRSGHLFNFSTFVEASRDIEIEYKGEEIFSIIFLLELIGKFYTQIIHQRYKVSINYVVGTYKNIFFRHRNNEYESFSCPGNDSIDGMLRPGDLRHIAILNMFLQGYDTVEIQRLAGHIHEETQLGYQRHMQFWVDSQIQQLAIDFSNHNIQNSSTDYKESIHPKAIEKFNKLYKHRVFVGKDTEEIPREQDLKIGYCNDETMPCPTFNWRHSGCYFCEHWGISEQELQEKREEIIYDMSLIYDQLKDKVNFMKSLLQIQLDEIGNFDKHAKKRLSVTSIEIQDGITNIARMISMLGVK